MSERDFGLRILQPRLSMGAGSTLCASEDGICPYMQVVRSVYYCQLFRGTLDSKEGKQGETVLPRLERCLESEASE